MDIEYTQVGYYYFPKLAAPPSPTLGRYGLLRQTYLREHRRLDYAVLLAGGRLSEDLERTDREASELAERLVSQLAQMQGVTEELKERDQLRWVQLMNNIRSTVDELVLSEVVYI